jgi:endonuclease/exonuclease/phosphatase family metal-dependent hydrolase
MPNSLVPALAALAAVTANAQTQVFRAPELLTFDEIAALAVPADPPAGTAARLERILNEPFITSARAGRPQAGEARIKAAFWNIERGREWQLIRLALTEPARFREAINASPGPEWERAAAELTALRDADIIILNEADLGMKRSGYAHVTKELAQALGMNYAFGVEFVEVDGLYTGRERIRMESAALTQALADDLRADPARYRGLHGNAVLSRFPIRSARIHRLPECYDWFGTEMRRIAALEKGRRWSAQRVFSQRIQRQVRRGGRMALIVELGTWDGTITAVSTHLEDRATPDCRRRQMEDLLATLHGAPGAVVLGGDLNTSGADGTPTSLQYEVMKRITDRRFWARSALQWFSPAAVSTAVLWPVNYLKNFRDPTAMSIPVVAPNSERALFRLLRSFRFADGGSFDFGASATLGNSNERSWKGFRPTYRFKRTYFGFVGAYRLDWLLVKGGAGESMRPRYPRTLSRFNKVSGNRLSDHHPILIDLDAPRAAVSVAAMQTGATVDAQR